MLCKEERRGQQRIPRIVAAQKAVVIIRHQHVRRSGSNEVRCMWRSETTSKVCGGTITCQLTASSRIISAGVISSSSCTS